MSGVGSAALRKFRAGKRLTRGEAIHAMCCSCMCDYADGRVDCQVISCPLHDFQPYRRKTQESASSKKKALLKPGPTRKTPAGVPPR